MELQLVNENIKESIGVLENVIATSCGIQYEHMFVVVDFGKSPNYDIILGFSSVAEVWHYHIADYIYLRRPKAITRINLIDHSYQDVAKTPIEEFETIISIGDDSDIPSWVNMRSYKGTKLETDKEGLNWDNEVN